MLALMGLLPPSARVSGEAAFAADGPSSYRQLTALDEHDWRKVRGREIVMIFQEPMTKKKKRPPRRRGPLQYEVGIGLRNRAAEQAARLSS
jgi:ABC-type microcin C transport system duplicated ATPase subunit YejF